MTPKPVRTAVTMFGALAVVVLALAAMPHDAAAGPVSKGATWGAVGGAVIGGVAGGRPLAGAAAGAATGAIIGQVHKKTK
ncbi:hypothetical protein H0I76_07540 [Limibaculum sp. M0105]|uniref:Glycine zipper domain-containing protein n=1 Tax=Thermohalobaculum xanthum TaxID=2753746 RepID=A0A8J7M6B0_9RHOB|nr:hypothetical protein [Thermohalobaculum xanthum]MBK0399038.1 hypothetical protein [Thermohalobaculum xanthum]